MCDFEELSRRKQELCISCQECCKVVVFIVPQITATDKPAFVSGSSVRRVEEFYTARGFRVHRGKSLTDEILIEVPSVCPHLTEGGCDIYERRPKACRLFDGLRDTVLSKRCRWRDLPPPGEGERP